MYTAIVLTQSYSDLAVAMAIRFGMVPTTPDVKMYAHHVTLAMGDASDRYHVGALRTVGVTHYGVTEGRVAAFRVTGAEDSVNEYPHVTICTMGDAKPRESNNIERWVHVPTTFFLKGTVQVCR